MLGFDGLDQRGCRDGDAFHSAIRWTKEDAAQIPAFFAVVEIPAVIVSNNAKSRGELIHELEGVITIYAKSVEYVGIEGRRLAARILREESG